MSLSFYTNLVLRLRAEAKQRDTELGQVKARLERDLLDKEAQVTRMQEAASRSQEETQRLEALLIEKEAAVMRMQEAAFRSQEESQRLETQLQEKVKLVDKRENTIKKLSAEIIKANEIISKLQVIIKNIS